MTNPQIEINETGAVLHHVAVLAGVGSALEAATMAASHLASCLTGCQCGGTMGCCAGCGKEAIPRHASDCAKRCAICPSAEAVIDLTSGMSSRIKLAEDLAVSHADLALILLCGSLSETMIGDLFCSFADVSISFDAAAWGPVMEHYETLTEHVHLDALIKAGGLMADGGVPVFPSPN